MKKPGDVHLGRLIGNALGHISVVTIYILKKKRLGKERADLHLQAGAVVGGPSRVAVWRESRGRHQPNVACWRQVIAPSEEEE